MKFFSKITFICNLCFIAFIILREVEKARAVNGNNEALVPLPALQNMLVILGVTAVVINFIFAVTCIVFHLLKKQIPAAKWLVWVNLMFLLFQFIYFKLY